MGSSTGADIHLVEGVFLEHELDLVGEIFLGLTTSGEEVEIPCDYVVMAVGSRKKPFDVTGVTVPVEFVGDCSGERTADIASAIRSAYHAANRI